MPANSDAMTAAKVSLPRAANIWVNRAKSKAKTRRIKDSFSIGQVVVESGGRYSITITNTAPEMGAFEFGSGLTSTRKAPSRYLIKSKSGKILTFLMPEALNIQYSKVKPDPDTGRVFLPQVMHPGVKPEPAMEPALRESSQEMARIIGQEFFVQVIYKDIRDAFQITSGHGRI